MSQAKVAKIYDKKESSIHEVLKKKKKTRLFYCLTLNCTSYGHSAQSSQKRHYICIRYFERERPYSHNFYYSMLL